MATIRERFDRLTNDAYDSIVEYMRKNDLRVIDLRDEMLVVTYCGADGYVATDLYGVMLCDDNTLNIVTEHSVMERYGEIPENLEITEDLPKGSWGFTPWIEVDPADWPERIAILGIASVLEKRQS